MNKYVIILIFFLIGISAIHAENSLDIKIQFICFKPTSVKIVHDNNWNGTAMEYIENNTFQYTYTTSSKNVLINFAFISKDSPKLSWVCVNEGIRNSNVYVNGILMTNDFLIDNGQGGTNISLKINNDGTFSLGAGDKMEIDDIPPESPHHKLYINTDNNPPPVQCRTFDGWIAVIHDNKYPNEQSSVEIEYLSVGINRNGLDELLVKDVYKNNDDIWELGGLYNRYPWFKPDRKLDDIKYYNTQNGGIAFLPSDNKCMVYHLWDNNHPPIMKGVTKYWVEAKVKITGKCYLQAGIDFIESTGVSHFESGASDWYKEKRDFQIVRFQNY